MSPLPALFNEPDAEVMGPEYDWFDAPYLLDDFNGGSPYHLSDVPCALCTHTHRYVTNTGACYDAACDVCEGACVASGREYDGTSARR